MSFHLENLLQNASWPFWWNLKQKANIFSFLGDEIEDDSSSSDSDEDDEGNEDDSQIRSYNHSNVLNV